jgi:hypothetical protein
MESIPPVGYEPVIGSGAVFHPIESVLPAVIVPGLK